ncbi:MAG: carboxypeptidase regulatory-like domain-containing protein [Planctomycetaceae bacterium]|nr:carboxypeptidase regulatory-like domain-containing protein [Planctomycetaceae bacterium]
MKRLAVGLLVVPMVAGLLCLPGCGSSVGAVSVTGTVTLDGEPVEGASVVFVPEGKGRMASGKTDSSGQFKLTTQKVGDGAVPGKYKVGVSKLKSGGVDARKPDPNSPEGVMLAGAPVGNGAPAMPEFEIPPKYSNAENSGLEVTVKSGMDPVKLELTR